ncbi:GH23525 [Drosophila grimshawi]|uniref:GH23525 n=1 Tax=Drosophila grimshawi TaxID=7222 RepID=B4K092_DROGR|nr:GH23525 [Drosophila grimshawi]
MLHENDMRKLSHALKDLSLVALNPTRKAQVLAHLCNDLLMAKAVLHQMDGSLETCAQMRKEKYMTDGQGERQAVHQRKARIEAYEKAQAEREATMQALFTQQKLDAERERKRLAEANSSEEKSLEEHSKQDHQLTGAAEVTTADTEQPMEVDAGAPLLTINSGNTDSWSNNDNSNEG